MGDFSIELAAERIVYSRTRRYFSEVFGTYSAGHYRSAVVMLWSVIVTDILFKLDQLSNAYGDHTTPGRKTGAAKTVRTFPQPDLPFGMNSPSQKTLEMIAKRVFPDHFKADPQGTTCEAFKWWREYVNDLPQASLSRDKPTVAKPATFDSASPV